jgi:hypothetical protein
MAVADDDPSQPNLESREPTLQDLRDLCRELNERSARYVVIGGFAIRAAGYNRSTMDVDRLGTHPSGAFLGAIGGILSPWRP